jgi:hypothetical protein
MNAERLETDGKEPPIFPNLAALALGVRWRPRSRLHAPTSVSLVVKPSETSSREARFRRPAAGKEGESGGRPARDTRRRPCAPTMSGKPPVLSCEQTVF